MTPIPTVPDTPVSPPDQEIGETSTYESLQVSKPAHPETVVRSHLQKSHVHGELNPGKNSDCIVCGMSPEENKRKTIKEYILSTTFTGETEHHMQTRIDAFVAGMNSGTFLFMPTGVSQAAACDGNNYTISCPVQKTQPGTVPIN